MATDTPIYLATLREAKRRTRKGSPERAVLEGMDERTTPAPFSAGGFLPLGMIPVVNPGPRPPFPPEQTARIFREITTRLPR